MAQGKNEFEQEADKSRSTFFGEVYYLLATNKKWWLLPILVCVTLLVVLVLFGGTGAAPFVYTIF